MAGFGLPIPEEADILLFAEDLVGYVMLGFDRSYRYPKTAEPYRRYIYNAFTDAVRHAVVFLCKKFNRGNFLKYEVLKKSRLFKDITVTLLQVMADDLYVQCFLKGFDARKFLFFCAQVSSMVGVFYVFGCREAPNEAVRQIDISLEYFHMQAGGWETLDAIARDISKLDRFHDCRYYMEDIVEEFKKCDSPRCLTPDVFSGDEEEHPLYGPLTKDLRPFDGIDEAWRDQMIKKYRGDLTSSEDSLSDSSEGANNA